MLLRRRLLLLFVGVVAGVVALGVATGIVIRERDDAQSRERRLSVGLQQISQLSSASIDQQTAERAYVLTGQQSFLDSYDQGRRRAAALTAQLRRILDRPELLQDLDHVTAAAATWRRDVAEQQIAVVRTNGPEAATALLAGRSSTTTFDRVTSRLATFEAKLGAEEHAASDHLDRVRNRLTWLFVAVSVLAAVGALGAAVLIRRWVTRPIDKLAGEVRRVRAGSLDSPILVGGPPELAALALDIDAMRGRIREQLVESERSRQAVEQSAAVVLTLRSQLEPDVGPMPDGWTVAATLRAAEGVVAGDCYDLFVTRPGELGLIVVDIAGHGATEGILALRCKEMLRTALTSGERPGEALDTTAELLGDMGSEVFLTAFVALIDTAEGVVQYANAGHPPALVVRDGRVDELLPTGPLVGLLAPGWSTAADRVGVGEILCVYTDGLIESRSPDNDFFGPERLEELLEGARCDQAPAVVKRCVDEVEAFAPDGLRDDATIVVLCRS